MNFSEMSLKRKLVLIITGIILLACILPYLFGGNSEPASFDRSSSSSREASHPLEGAAIARCKKEVKVQLNINNVDFESSVIIGIDERLTNVGDRFTLKSWYDSGDGIERRYTCVIKFNNDDEFDYSAVVSDGW